MPEGWFDEFPLTRDAPHSPWVDKDRYRANELNINRLQDNFLQAAAAYNEDTLAADQRLAVALARRDSVVAWLGAQAQPALKDYATLRRAIERRHPRLIRDALQSCGPRAGLILDFPCDAADGAKTLRAVLQSRAAYQGYDAPDDYPDGFAHGLPAGATAVKDPRDYTNPHLRMAANVPSLPPAPHNTQLARQMWGAAVVSLYSVRIEGLYEQACDHCNRTAAQAEAIEQATVQAARQYVARLGQGAAAQYAESKEKGTPRNGGGRWHPFF